MAEWPIEEVVIFEGETRIKKTYENGTIIYELRDASQGYMDSYIAPCRPKAVIRRLMEEHAGKRSVRINRLGDARCTDPIRIAEEDAVFTEVTETIGIEELEQIVSKLGWLADKTFAQVDNYIINNVNNLAEAKAFLRIQAKIVLANIKLTRMLLNRELSPS